MNGNIEVLLLHIQYVINRLYVNERFEAEILITYAFSKLLGVIRDFGLLIWPWRGHLIKKHKN